MAYCTADDVIDQIPAETLAQLCFDGWGATYETEEARQAAIDAAVAERTAAAIDDAEALIDGYLAGRYAVPLAPVPAVVRKCAVDLAVYNLFARKDQIPEARTQRYKDVVKVLEAVAAGKVTLGLPKPPDPPDDGDYEGGGRIAARPKIFSPDFVDRY